MKIRTLLVDDEEPARDRLRGLLAGFDDVEIIDTAADGEEAIQKIVDKVPDLVFLDIEMPGKTGMEVAAALEPPRPRIIFCTAYDQYAVNAFEHHAVDYLLKPLSLDRLAKTLQRVREAMNEQEGLRREVNHASHTQARLFPRASLSRPGLDLCGSTRAAQGVGGDYYDFLPVGEERLGITVGDVSGKGLYAGLLMAGLQARMQSLAPLKGDDLPGLLEAVNVAMHSSTESNRYVTLFYALYESSTRALRYVNAGHEPPLLCRCQRGRGPTRSYRTHRLEATGTAVGLMGGSTYGEATLAMQPGDILLAFSDGLVEAANAGREEFGHIRIVAFVNEHGGGTAQQLRDGLLKEVDRFRGGHPQQDDITLVVAKAL